MNAAKQYLMFTELDNTHNINNNYYLRTNLFDMVDTIYDNFYKKDKTYIGNKKDIISNTYNKLIILFSSEIDVSKLLRSLIIFIYATYNLFGNITQSIRKNFITKCYIILNNSKKDALKSIFKFSTLEIILYNGLDIMKEYI